MRICLFYVLTKTKRFEIVIQGLETKLIKLNQITKKKLTQKYFCSAGHIYMLAGHKVFFRGPHSIQKNYVLAGRRFFLGGPQLARGPQFADPCNR